MQSPYPKPAQISDPLHECGEDVLEAVLAKRQEELTLDDYDVIFWTIHTTTYEAGAYYLASCFELMQRKADPYESNVCIGVFQFISYHRRRLKQDKLLAPCLEATGSLLRRYTDSFELARKGDDETEFHAIDQTLPEVVKYEDSVADLFHVLIEYGLYRKTLSDFLDWLNDDAIIKSCWWIIISHYARDWYGNYRSDDPSNQRKQVFLSRLFKLNDYAAHSRRHLHHVRDREQVFSKYEARICI